MYSNIVRVSSLDQGQRAWPKGRKPRRENDISDPALAQSFSDFQPDCEAATPVAGQNPGLLTIREAAALLRLSESTIRNAIRLGQLRAFRFGVRGGSIRISQADLDDYIAGAATAPLIARTPVPAGGRFKHLDASKLLAAWRKQGVLGAPRDGNNAPSSGSNDGPSTPRGF